jgi:hypothetical protein
VRIPKGTYTISATADTGELGGIIKASKKITVKQP